MKKLILISLLMANFAYGSLKMGKLDHENASPNLSPISFVKLNDGYAIDFRDIRGLYFSEDFQIDSLELINGEIIPREHIHSIYNRKGEPAFIQEATWRMLHGGINGGG